MLLLYHADQAGMSLLRSSIFLQTKCRTMTISMKTTYLSVCLLSFFCSFLLSFFCCFLISLFMISKPKKKRIQRDFFIYYLSEDPSTIITLLFSISSISCISCSAVDTKNVKYIKLSDNRTPFLKNALFLTMRKCY